MSKQPVMCDACATSQATRRVPETIYVQGFVMVKRHNLCQRCHETQVRFKGIAALTEEVRS